MAWIEKKPSGRYLVRWREPDGRAASKIVPTKDEAKAMKARVESELHSGSYIAQVARTRAFGDYVSEVLESELNLEDSTRYQQARLYERWIRPHLGPGPLGDIDAAAIRRLFAVLRREGASDTTIGRVRNFLGKILRRAHQEGVLPRNPVAVVPAPKLVRREIRILTPHEVQAIANASDPRYRLVPLLSAWGTFRIGEVGALNEDVLEGDRITVKRAVTTAGSRTYLKGPKTAAGRRTVQMPSWVMQELREHLVRYRDPDGWIFKTPTGQFLSHISYHRIWRAALKAVNFPKPWPVPHDLRHTAVALMIRAGAHPKQIQARCGHATIKETMDTYGHLFPGHDDELVRALESFRPQEAKVIPIAES